MRKESKKLNWKNAKYIIKKILNSYSVKLDIPKNINDIFHIDKLYAINIDPFFSQLIDNTQPSSIQDNSKDVDYKKNHNKNKKKKRKKKKKKIEKKLKRVY